jgi:hypothetical protein
MPMNCNYSVGCSKAHRGELLGSQVILLLSLHIRSTALYFYLLNQPPVSNQKIGRDEGSHVIKVNLHIWRTAINRADRCC